MKHLQDESIIRNNKNIDGDNFIQINNITVAIIAMSNIQMKPNRLWVPPTYEEDSLAYCFIEEIRNRGLVTHINITEDMVILMKEKYD